MPCAYDSDNFGKTNIHRDKSPIECQYYYYYYYYYYRYIFRYHKAK